MRSLFNSSVGLGIFLILAITFTNVAYHSHKPLFTWVAVLSVMGLFGCLVSRAIRLFSNHR